MRWGMLRSFTLAKYRCANRHARTPGQFVAAVVQNIHLRSMLNSNAKFRISSIIGDDRMMHDRETMS